MGITSKLPKIAILASGRGSNFAALQQSILDQKLHAEIILVASDKKEAAVLEKAASYGIPTLFEKDQKALLSALQSLMPDYIVLAGYMRILKPEFIQAFRDSRGFSKIVNIHPSLLPAFPGVNSYQQAFNHGVKVTGASVHFVDLGIDTGPICAQRSFSIEDCASVAEVEARGLKVEHALYPETLNWILKNHFDITERGGRLHVQPH